MLYCLWSHSPCMEDRGSYISSTIIHIITTWLTALVGTQLLFFTFLVHAYLVLIHTDGSSTHLSHTVVLTRQSCIATDSNSQPTWQYPWLQGVCFRDSSGEGGRGTGDSSLTLSCLCRWCSNTYSLYEVDVKFTYIQLTLIDFDFINKVSTSMQITQITKTT